MASLSKRKRLAENASEEKAIYEAVEDLRKSIDIIPIKNINMYRLAVPNFDPLAAAKIANVVSRSYIIFDLEQQLAEYQFKYGETHEIVRQLKADVNRLIGRITPEPRPIIEAIGPASVKSVAPAAVPKCVWSYGVRVVSEAPRGKPRGI
jgi:hypothetical protein